MKRTYPWVGEVLKFFVSSFAEDGPLIPLIMVRGKRKEREVWSVTRTILASGNSAILYHDDFMRKKTENFKLPGSNFTKRKRTWLGSIGGLYLF